MSEPAKEEPKETPKETTPSTEPKKLTNQDIINQYNQTRQKYSLFFEKAVEIEQELSEHK